MGDSQGLQARVVPVARPAVATMKLHASQDFTRPPLGYQPCFCGLILHLQAKRGGDSVPANRFSLVTEILDLYEIGGFHQGMADLVEYGDGRGRGIEGCVHNSGQPRLRGGNISLGLHSTAVQCGTELAVLDFFHTINMTRVCLIR